MTEETRELGSCLFCAIAAGRAEASVVHDDDTAIAFLDLHPVTRGHLLVVPRVHSVGLEDLDPATGAHLWSVAHLLSRALRRSALGVEGIDLLLCDGEAAFQTVLHTHLHVIPRYRGDGWTIEAPAPLQQERARLDEDARVIRDAVG